MGEGSLGRAIGLAHLVDFLEELGELGLVLRGLERAEAANVAEGLDVHIAHFLDRWLQGETEGEVFQLCNAVRESNRKLVPEEAARVDHLALERVGPEVQHIFKGDSSLFLECM